MTQGKTIWRMGASTIKTIRIILAALLAALFMVAPVASATSTYTWSRTSSVQGSSYSWYWITASSDGSHAYAVQGTGGGIYASTDYGATWSKTSAPSASWETITTSANGAIIYAVQHSGYIYMSTDSGSTWTQTTAPSGPWWSVATSSTGAVVYATQSTGGIYKSTDSGTTWAATSAPSAKWYSIATSQDGRMCMRCNRAVAALCTLRATAVQPGRKPAPRWLQIRTGKVSRPRLMARMYTPPCMVVAFMPQLTAAAHGR